MTPEHGDHLRLLLLETIRRWPRSTIYVVLALTTNLVLAIWDRLHGPASSVCRTAAAILTGS